MRGHRKQDDEVISCLAWVFLGLFVLPFFAIHWVIKGDNEGKRTLGIIILVVYVIAMIIGVING